MFAKHGALQQPTGSLFLLQNMSRDMASQYRSVSFKVEHI